MGHILHMIKGIPYGKNKTRGNINGQPAWTERVIEETKALPKVKHACILKVTFLLPPDKFPADLPHGPDLDNLMKRFFDALNITIFSEAEGTDSCVVELGATKTKVESADKAGAFIQVLPVMI